MDEDGVMMVFCSCVNCGATLCVDPDRVPSLRINGQREPICRACHTRWNKIHRSGLEPLPIQEGAYYGER